MASVDDSTNEFDSCDQRADVGDESQQSIDRERFFGVTSQPDSEYLQLARTIESEIIPRLLLAHRYEAKNRRSAEARNDDDDLSEVEQFTQIVLTEETEVAHSYISGLLARGVSVEMLFLKLLGPAARRLGKMWEDDDCHFTDVTMALCRLQQLLREFSTTLGAPTDQFKLGFRVLLAPVPSDQHTFGILMVEEFFRRSGWNVFGIPSATEKEILEAVRNEWFAVVGLSMSCDTYAPKLSSLITLIRRMSRNPALVVLVGGRYFNDNPEQAMLQGADATAVDGHQAILQTQGLIRLTGRKN